MRSSRLCWLTIGSLVFALLSQSAAATTQVSSKSFAIFDATQYRDKPDLAKYGFRPVRLHSNDVATPRALLRGGQQGFSATKVHATALLQAKHPDELVTLDLETWKLDAAGIKKYGDTLRIFKQGSPHSIVGYYGYMPYGNWLLYAANDTHSSYDRQKWEQLQDQAEPVGRVVDVFMPSLYTWGNNQTAWQETAKEAIAYARKVDPGKKIYAYIWPQYDDNHTPYQLKFLPPAVWRAELETLYPIADGVIIWSGWKDPAGKDIKFSLSMPWFVQTRAFMEEHHLN